MKLWAQPTCPTGVAAHRIGLTTESFFISARPVPTRAGAVFSKKMSLVLTSSIDVVVATNSVDMSLSCLEIIYMCISNAAEPENRFKRINKLSHIYQVLRFDSKATPFKASNCIYFRKKSDVSMEQQTL